MIFCGYALGKVWLLPPRKDIDSITAKTAESTGSQISFNIIVINLP